MGNHWQRTVKRKRRRPLGGVSPHLVRKLESRTVSMGFRFDKLQDNGGKYSNRKGYALKNVSFNVEYYNTIIVYHYNN